MPSGPPSGVDPVMRADDLVWYVAYGSNLHAPRLRSYLEGGDGPFGEHRGCTDPTPPRADRWLVLDRGVAFRGVSPRWGGGVSFLDRVRTAGTATPARAWLVAVGQLLDLAAQEARLRVAPDPAVLDGLPVDGTVVVGGGWYDTLLRLDDVDGLPALAVTTSQDLMEVVPTDAYRATILAGLAERPSAQVLTADEAPEWGPAR